MSGNDTDDNNGSGAWRERRGPLDGFARTAEFWRRAAFIYGTYKVTQLKAAALRASGRSQVEVEAEVWTPQHTWAGQEMYDLCIALRGFYLKVSPASYGCKG